MEPRLVTCITAMTLFAALAIPVRRTAESNHNKQQPRYKLIELGTFGGPSGNTSDETQVVNSRGTLVGFADTSTPDPTTPTPAFFVAIRSFSTRSSGRRVPSPTLVPSLALTAVLPSGLVKGGWALAGQKIVQSIRRSAFPRCTLFFGRTVRSPILERWKVATRAPHSLSTAAAKWLASV